MMDIIDQLSEFLPIDSAFEIERVEKSESDAEAHIYLQVRKEATPPGHSIHSYYKRTWEHLRLFQYRTFIHCHIPIYRDHTTGKLHKPEITFSRDYSRFTLMFEKHLMRLLHLHHCFTTVAKQLGINVQRVESIYHRYTRHIEADSISTPPVRIACDETSARKGHDYITTVYDLDAQKIIGIYDGKSSACLEEFFHDHPYPPAVTDISIDMSPAFIAGATTCFPHARITFDKWHVIKLMHRHLKDLRGKANYFNDRIGTLLDTITDFYNLGSLEEAKSQLSFIADFADECMGDNSLSTSIRRHCTGITNYFISNINNGIMEGLNAKIQTIKRMARGFRYTENFKKMIRFVFGDFNFASKFI
jgi:transposase